MSKCYEVLSELPPPLRDGAHEILDAILASGDLVNWDHQLRLIVDGRTYPNTNIADLVSNVLYSHDERAEEPRGFSIFVQALKDIQLESDWVHNELVKDILDGNNSDPSTDSESDDDDDDDDKESNSEEDDDADDKESNSEDDDKNDSDEVAH